MSSQNNQTLDDEDETVVAAMEDIIAYFIKVDDYDDHFRVDDTEKYPNPDFFSHLETIEDNVPMSFTALLQDIAFVHAAAAALTTKDSKLSLKVCLSLQERPGLTALELYSVEPIASLLDNVKYRCLSRCFRSL